MPNLLEETLAELEFHKLNPDDVLWVGLANGTAAISWAVFADLADFEYADGCRELQISPELVVVGKAWWLKRMFHHELDHTVSEWWELCQKPKKSRKAMTMSDLRVDWMAVT